MSALIERRSACLRKLAGCRAREVRFGRFLNNPSVRAEEIIATAAQATGERAAGRPVLAIQDTTEINFRAHARRKRGFGTVGNGRDIGLFLHPLLVLDAESGGVLGLADAQILNRTGGTGKAPARKRRAIGEKESQRWLSGVRAAETVLSGALSVTVVADRESDIYEEFARRPEGVHLITRAAQDRALAGGGRLFATVRGWPEQSRQRLAVPPKPGRLRRQAEVAVRFGEVELKRPAHVDKRLAASVRLAVVDVEEGDPPPGETPVHWLLLTSHALDGLADAERIIGCYRRRWSIEQVFRTLKGQGFDIEQSQIVEAERLTKLLMAALIAAVAVLQLVHARDGTSRQRLADAATDIDVTFLTALNARLEGKTAKQTNPHPPDSLAYLAWIVGRLGGWSGYLGKGYKPPGPKTMHDGLRQLQAMQNGWSLTQHV